MTYLKDILYIISVIPILFLAIFVLFIVLRLPSIVEKSSKDVSRDKPRMDQRRQALLTMFYSLDELKTLNKYKLVYYMGIIGVVGTTLWIIYFTAYFIYLVSIR